MTKKASTFLIGCLCIALSAFLGLAVYANLSSSLDLSNKISFTPDSQSIYYYGQVSVWQNDVVQTSAKIDHDGKNIAGDDTTDHLNLYTPRFTKEDNKLVYVIKIYNYTQTSDLHVSITLNRQLMLDNTQTVAVENKMLTANSFVYGSEKQNPQPLTAVGNMYSATIDSATVDDYQGNLADAPHVEFQIETTCVYFAKSFNLQNYFDFTLTISA